jgi:ribonuclease HI
MTVDAINSLAILGKEIKNQWVRGHYGTTGNDKADLMAKEGAAMASLGPA